MAVNRLKQGLPKRIRAAEVAQGITATKSDRVAFKKRIVALEAALGMRGSTAAKTDKNRHGLEARLRAVDDAQ